MALETIIASILAKSLRARCQLCFGTMRTPMGNRKYQSRLAHPLGNGFLKKRSFCSNDAKKRCQQRKDQRKRERKGVRNVFGHDTITSPGHSIAWSLDPVGNFSSTTTDGGSAVNRTHNKQNEVTALGASTLTFDANGNTTTDDNGKTLVYDGPAFQTQVFLGRATHERRPKIKNIVFVLFS